MDNFSPEALEIIYASKMIAHQSGSSCVELLHVFQALLREDAGDVVPLLAPARKGLAAAFRLIGKTTDSGVPGGMQIFAFPLSPDVMELCTRAQGLAARWHHAKVGNVHLLHSLMGMECTELLPILEDFGLDPYRLMSQCVVILKRMPPSDLPSVGSHTVVGAEANPPALPPLASPETLKSIAKEIFDPDGAAKDRAAAYGKSQPPRTVSPEENASRRDEIRDPNGVTKNEASAWAASIWRIKRPVGPVYRLDPAAPPEKIEPLPPLPPQVTPADIIEGDSDPWNMPRFDGAAGTTAESKWGQELPSAQIWKAFTPSSPSLANSPAPIPSLPPITDGERLVRGWITKREKTADECRVSRSLSISSNPDDWMDEDVISVLAMATDLSRINESAIHLDHLVLALIEGDLSGSVSESFRSVVDPEELKNRLKTNLQTGEYPRGDALFSDQTVVVFRQARDYASQMGRRKISIRDLLMGLLSLVSGVSIHGSSEAAPAFCLKLTLLDSTAIRSRYDELARLRIPQPVPLASESEPQSCPISFPVSFQVISLLNAAKDEAGVDRAPEATNVHVVMAWLKSAQLNEHSLSLLRTSILDQLHAASLWGAISASTSVVDFSEIKISDEVKASLSLACKQARRIGQERVQINHVLLAMMDQDLAVVEDIFRMQKTSKEVIRRRLNWCSEWHRRAVDHGPERQLNLCSVDDLVNNERWPAAEHITPTKPSFMQYLSARSKELLDGATTGARLHAYFNEPGSSSAGNISGEISVEQIAVALAQIRSGIVSDAILDAGGMLDASGEIEIHSTFVPRGRGRSCRGKLSRKAKMLLQEAYVHARKFGRGWIEPEHILLAIATAGDGLGYMACNGVLGIENPQQLSAQLIIRLQSKSA